MHADAFDPDTLARYEGLVFKTAQLTAPKVEDDFDDVRQIFRIKVFQALRRWDPDRASSRPDIRGLTPRDRYVFSCVANQAKDLVKKKRHGLLSIEDITTDADGSSRDQFDEKYLATSPDEVYGLIEEDSPLIPSTITDLERRVMCLLYADYRQPEVARYLGIPKRDVERLLRSIRMKMADWAPDGSELELEGPLELELEGPLEAQPETPV